MKSVTRKTNHHPRSLTLTVGPVQHSTVMWSVWASVRFNHGPILTAALKPLLMFHCITHRCYLPVVVKQSYQTINRCPGLKLTNIWTSNFKLYHCREKLNNGPYVKVIYNTIHRCYQIYYPSSFSPSPLITGKCNSFIKVQSNQDSDRQTPGNAMLCYAMLCCAAPPASSQSVKDAS